MKDDKRQDYIDWDSFFLGTAILAALRSKDPKTVHGACIVDQKNRVISIGYNGLPAGCSDNDFHWSRENIPGWGTKYDWVLCAEENAILNCRNLANLDGSTLYLYSSKGYLPCSACARKIAQVGIAAVVVGFLGEEKTIEYDFSITRRIFQETGVEIFIGGKNGSITTESIHFLTSRLDEALEDIKPKLLSL